MALGKFWVCKRTSPMVAEALECLGGNGYVEENGLARLYREAPLNSIWEGSGNVGALDVLRAIAREPASVAALDKELALARGHDRVLDAAIDACGVAVAGGAGRGRAVGCAPARRAARDDAPGEPARAALPGARSPTRSSPPGCGVTGARSSAPSTPGWAPGPLRPSSTGRCRPDRHAAGSPGQGDISSRVRSASTSKSAAGHCGSIVSSASSSRFVTASREYHLRSAGTTCQGATAVEHFSSAAW